MLLHYQLGMSASPAQYIRGVLVNGSLVAQWSYSWPFVNTQESWFMHNDNGARHCGPNMFNCILNISNVSAQNWWLDEAIAGMRAAGAQGVFADTFVEGISGYDVVLPDNRFAGVNPSVASAWPNGITWLQQRLNWINKIADAFAQTPEQFLLIPNLNSQATGWDTTNFAGSRLDGALLEGIALDTTTRSDWALEMNRAIALAAAGKIVIFHTYPQGNQGSATFKQTVDYAIASYLLIRAITPHHLLGGNTNKATGIYYYPHYDTLQQLGRAVASLPGGVASYLWSGVYRRDFQHGSVLVNPSASTVTVSLPHDYLRLNCTGGGEMSAAEMDPATFKYLGGSCSTASVTSLTLAPRTGVVLFNPGVSVPEHLFRMYLRPGLWTR